MTKPDRDDDDFLTQLDRDFKDAFQSAAKNVKDGARVAADELRRNINRGRRGVGAAYGFVERTVGKDRLLGAAVGAKIGGVIGTPGGPVGIFKLGAVGTVVGFIGGRKFLNWLDNEGKAQQRTDATPAPEQNNTRPAEPPAPGSKGPQEPGPG